MKSAIAPLLVLSLALPGCSDDDGGGPTEAIAFNELVNACIVSSACGVKRYPRISDCVKAYYDLHLGFGLGPVYDSIFGCLAEAKGDCEAAFACYGSHPAAGSCDVSYTAKCSGDKNLTCDTQAGPEGRGLVFTFDCAKAGLSCQTRASGGFEADCTAGTCTPGEPRRCDGNRLLSCKATESTLEVEDCAVRGLVCDKSPLSGALECTGEVDEECNTTQDNQLQPRCEGSVAVTCVNNKQHREDCAKRLYDTSCSAGQCAAKGSACTGDDFNRCQGDKMQYCLDGSWHEVDCTALGLGPCASGTIAADCTPNNS
jgi:hypothetical protein